MVDIDSLRTSHQIKYKKSWKIKVYTLRYIGISYDIKKDLIILLDIDVITITNLRNWRINLLNSNITIYYSISLNYC